jgi:hypothetical protein
MSTSFILFGFLYTFTIPTTYINRRSGLNIVTIVKIPSSLLFSSLLFPSLPLLFDLIPFVSSDPTNLMGSKQKLINPPAATSVVKELASLFKVPIPRLKDDGNKEISSSTRKPDPVRTDVVSEKLCG